jgi:hypothetical protein
VIGLAILAYRGTRLDKESSVHADAALKAIATDWSEKALLERASPEFKQAVPIDQLDAYFGACSKLGHLQQAEPMKGQAGISYHQMSANELKVYTPPKRSSTLPKPRSRLG